MGTSVAPPAADVSGVHALPWQSAVSTELDSVVFVGNPNSGKTTLFNKLSGSDVKTGNFPGVTVEAHRSIVRLPSGTRVVLTDLPGIHSIATNSIDEKVALDHLIPFDGKPPSVIVVTCDSTRLARDLYLVSHLLETQIPLVVALTLSDEARERKIEIDTENLSARLGVPVERVSSRTAEGLGKLLNTIEQMLDGSYRGHTLPLLPEPLQQDIDDVQHAIERAHTGLTRPIARSRAIWAILSHGTEVFDFDTESSVARAVREVLAHAEQDKRDLAAEIIAPRFEWVDKMVQESVRLPKEPWNQKLDRWLVRPWPGIPLACITALVIFEILFVGAEPITQAISWTLGWLSTNLKHHLPPGPLNALITDGVIAGVGNVVTFVPQIAFLFFAVGFLEDSGYLARIAFLLDRIMQNVGLNGRAFIPMLSGFACAVPAILSTRTLENRRDRILTMMVIPLTSCSARLPVYALLIALMLPPSLKVGFIPAGGLVLGALYLLSLFSAVTAAWALRKFVIRSPSTSLIIELPPYRRPRLRGLTQQTFSRVKSFLTEAGTIILAMSVVMWAMLHYPKSETIKDTFDDQRAAISKKVDLSPQQKAQELSRIDHQERTTQVENSYAGRLGKAMSPLLAPLGFDWKIGVGIMGSFVAREVLISTLGIVYGVEDADEDHVQPLNQQLRRSHTFTPLVALTLIVFYVYACQCVSTLAVVRRESGSWRWPVLLFVYMTVLAYAFAWTVRHVGFALGLS